MNEFQELLKSIQSGQKHFSPKTNQLGDMEAFQHVAKMPIHADQKGLIDDLKTHRESSSGNSWYNLAFITGGLSYQGEIFANMEPQRKEILELKPTFHGVSVDIKEAVIRLIQRWKSEGTK
jgi:hypothetical protein